MNQRDPVGSNDLLQCRPEGFYEQSFMPARIGDAYGRVVIDFTDEVGEHFGVCLRRKVMRSIAQKRFFDLLVILDYAVMDKREFAALVEMRMSVLISRFAVRCPASVTDPVSAGRGRFGKELRESGDTPRTFPGFNMIAVHD